MTRPQLPFKFRPGTEGGQEKSETGQNLSKCAKSFPKYAGTNVAKLNVRSITLSTL